jgi:predicted transcriptional regulator
MEDRVVVDTVSEAAGHSGSGTVLRVVLSFDERTAAVVMAAIAVLAKMEPSDMRAMLDRMLTGKEAAPVPAPVAGGRAKALPAGEAQGVSLPIPADRPPAVDPRESVLPDALICLEDGKRLTMLKRYIKSRFNLTPDQYRARWGLPSDYPMVAPRYAMRRSDIARQSGLGKSGRKSRKAEAQPSTQG